jgi:hypothetical protein
MNAVIDNVLTGVYMAGFNKGWSYSRFNEQDPQPMSFTEMLDHPAWKAHLEADMRFMLLGMNLSELDCLVQRERRSMNMELHEN